jgi:two-component system response regulator DcuR
LTDSRQQIEPAVLLHIDIQQHQIDLLLRIVNLIMITSAADAATVQTAMHYGVVDYLIKPFQFPRFGQLARVAGLRRAAVQQAVNVGLLVIGLAGYQLVVDYLIKPFQFPRFEEALTTWREKRKLITGQPYYAPWRHPPLR